ncbi:MAG: MATE family efflux transporter [Paramuribaculum sp.]|nr:MATE family efflux transporter [Paramuribaculum sp.]
MQRDSIDLGTIRIPRLFKIYFIPTLLGMLALCAVTATDGIFVGRGVGSDGLAAVNICISPTMVLMGISLMLGVGASVVSSIHLANNNVTAARLNITQAMLIATIIVVLFLCVTLVSPATTGKILGSSDSLMPLVTEYMPWIFVACLFQSWAAIGLFVVRLDGSPQYAMWCNVIPGLLNVVLDYIYIFPLDMGVKGAAIATCISCAVGGFMVIVYLGKFAETLRLIKIKLTRKSIALTMRNISYQCKIGISALLGEATMGMLMLMGNLMFMKYMGDNGVGAFSIACYYCPFAFMIGNAIAQSAQPIISYNYVLGYKKRVVATEKLAILSAIGCGLIVTAAFIFIPGALTELFLDSNNPSAQITFKVFPLFSAAFVFFIFNLTAIGYFQSVEKVIPSIAFALLRGIIFLVPSFLLMPVIFGDAGIWLALFVSESLTSASIIIYYFCNRCKTKPED